MFFTNIYTLCSNHFAHLGYYNIINQILFGEILYVEFIDLTNAMMIPNSRFGTFFKTISFSQKGYSVYLEFIPIKSDYYYISPVFFSKTHGVLNLIDDAANITINKPFKGLFTNSHTFMILNHDFINPIVTPDYPYLKINYKRFH
jgi:hypothetical protein